MIQIINQKLGFCPYLKKTYFKKLGFCPYAFLIYCREMHIPADTRSAFPVISVQSPVSIQCCWQS